MAVIIEKKECRLEISSALLMVLAFIKMKRLKPRVKPAVFQPIRMKFRRIS